jgi:hypothetical protein
MRESHLRVNLQENSQASIQAFLDAHPRQSRVSSSFSLSLLRRRQYSPFRCVGLGT